VAESGPIKPLDPSARASRREFDVHLTENVMLPMRDGVRLATDVYRPARDGRPLDERRPVLLHRTPTTRPRPRPPAASAATSPPAATWW
jgi:predicted acyl esterase